MIGAPLAIKFDPTLAPVGVPFTKPKDAPKRHIKLSVMLPLALYRLSKPQKIHVCKYYASNLRSERISVNSNYLVLVQGGAYSWI
jgi:hypothetical protein